MPDAEAGFYDDVFAKSDVFAVHYSKSPYLTVWDTLARRISSPARVLEVGCGSGQLAQMLDERRLLAGYVGFDISQVAVDAAQRRCPHLRFEVADAFATELFSGDYDLVICTEVLEHVNEDRALLRRIRPGVHVLASVPDFFSASHVRWFPTKRHVVRRYKPELQRLEVVPRTHPNGRTLYLLDGYTSDLRD